MALDIDSALGVHQQALSLRTQRAQLLATNIANADTPNYKAVDIDFKTALSQAQSQSNGVPMAATNVNHITESDDTSAGFTLMYRTPMQPSLDGNTVDTQLEKAEFTRNAVQHQASLMFLTHRIKDILTAIKGG